MRGYITTLGEIMKYTGRGRRVLMRWIKREGFPAVFKDDMWMALPGDVDDWLRKHIKAKRSS